MARKLTVGLVLLGAVVAITLTAPVGADYPGPPCATCDYAGPPIEALVHGHVGTFFHTQPMMGSFSLLLRAPFAAASYLAGHTLRSEYRLGALACLLVLGLLAWALTGVMERQGKGLFSQLVVAALCVAGPMTFKSLSWGHPEELLAGALCVLAVLLAWQRRSTAAGVVLGLSLATRPWALLVVLVVLAVAQERRLRLVLVAAATAAILLGPMLVGDPSRFWHMAQADGIASNTVTPPDIWWQYGREAGILITPHGEGTMFTVPAWVWAVARPLVLGLGVLLAGGYWRSRRSLAGSRHGLTMSAGDLSTALHLVALVLLVRCMFDPNDYSYYHAPFLIALSAAGAVGSGRLPYAAIVSAAALWILNAIVAAHHGGDTLHAAYLIWSLPTAAYLGLKVFAADYLRDLKQLLRPSRPQPAALS